MSSGSKAVCHFHWRVIARRKLWFHLRMSSILFAAKHSWMTLHMSRPFCGQLFACHVVGSRPIKMKKKFAVNDNTMLSSTFYACLWGLLEQPLGTTLICISKPVALCIEEEAMLLSVFPIFFSLFFVAVQFQPIFVSYVAISAVLCGSFKAMMSLVGILP